MGAKWPRRRASECPGSGAVRRRLRARAVAAGRRSDQRALQARRFGAAGPSVAGGRAGEPGRGRRPRAGSRPHQLRRLWRQTPQKRILARHGGRARHRIDHFPKSARPGRGFIASCSPANGWREWAVIPAMLPALRRPVGPEFALTNEARFTEDVVVGEHSPPGSAARARRRARTSDKTRRRRSGRRSGTAEPRARRRVSHPIRSIAVGRGRTS